MPDTWLPLVNNINLTGEYITAPLSISLPATKLGTDSVRTFGNYHVVVGTIPTGATVACYKRESVDGGLTWGVWSSAVSSGVFLPTSGTHSYLFESTVDANYDNYRLQLKYVFSTPDVSKIPIIQLASQLSYVAHAAIWTSPVIDWSGYALTSNIVSAVVGRNAGAWDSTPNRDTDYSVVIQVRSGYTSDDLGEWVTCTLGEQLPSVGGFMQLRCAFIGDSALTRVGSFFDSVTLTAIRAGGLQGVWTSPVVIASEADDKASGEVLLDVTSGTDTKYTVHTRSRANSSSPWSSWTTLDATNKCQHPANDEVQIQLQFSGINTKINSIDLMFDGEPKAVPLLTGVSSSAIYDFAVLNNIFIMVNGVMSPKKWTGTGQMVALEGSPPVFSCLEVHNNSLWGVEKGTSRIRKSAALDPEKWGVLDFFDFNPDDGDYITAILRVGSSLLVSKSRSMAMLLGNTSATYNIRWLEATSGAQGVKALCVAGSYVCYVSTNGIILTDFLDYPVISEKVQDAWDNLNKRKLSNAKLFFWNDCIYCLLTSKDSLVNDQMWIYDTRYGAWDIQDGYALSDMISYTVGGENKLLALDSLKGQVYSMDEGVLTPEGTRTSYVWQTKTFDMGYPERYKLFKGIYLDIEGIDVASDLKMYFIVDDIELPDFYTTTIPAGEGEAHSRWILPPLFNAVLGTHLALKFEGSVGIKGISVEYVTRGVSPEGLA